ncbi:hypothetical protein HHL17_08985 [Chitinophaga sp. G-6-1-13]|uniref:Uncharacterized protein n=1 Tax=Chitinophaga fulva TaxID=2728842 RepID=A0A848GHZ0_9BACT|nr:hypothetical protein [Chitinophaga fulva]NML37331.1 hypothetical protein [Chitinophaga fulva]
MPVIDADKYSSTPGYQLVYELESQKPSTQEMNVVIRSTSERSLHTNMIKIKPEGYTFRTYQGWRVIFLCYGSVVAGVLMSGKMKVIYIPFVVASTIILGLLIIFKFKWTSSRLTTDITVDPKGITTKGALYPWRDLSNTFIVERIKGKSRWTHLVLVTPEQRYKYIKIEDYSLNGVPRLATAIAHFSNLAGKTD